MHIRFLYRFILITLIGMAGHLYANAQDTINLVRSGRLNVLVREGLTRVYSDTVNGKIIQAEFSHGTTLLYADSAIRSNNENKIDAYGHVHINNNDSVHTYSDIVNFDGNTKIATLRGNARLVQGGVVITSPEMIYDMNAKIGSYINGGKLVNEGSTLTSREAFYYTEPRDVYFRGNVVLVNPDYTLSTDTLLYNTETKIATIVAPTTINDGKRITYVTSGYYNTNTGQGDFEGRPLITDSTGDFTADRINVDKMNGVAIAIGNMVWRDTVNKIILLGNYGQVNQTDRSVLATQRPVAITYSEKDSLFMTGDTMFSGVILPDTAKVFPKDSLLSVHAPDMEADSLVQSTDSAADAFRDRADAAIDSVPNAFRQRADAAIAGRDSIPRRVNAGMDSVAKRIDAARDSIPKQIAAASDAIPKQIDAARDSIRQRVDATIAVRKDSLPKVTAMRPQRDSLPLKRTMDMPGAITFKTDSLPSDSAATPKDTTEKRYIKAYHNVRIFSDSLQAVCDSAYYSSVDSVFRMFKEPVIWVKELQMSGDTVYLFTKDKKADRMLLDQSGLLASEVTPGFYNQIKGNTITGYFRESKLYYMRIYGNAESIVFQQDQDSAFTNVQRSTCAIIDMHFVDGELEYIVNIKDHEGGIYPFTQFPIDQRTLSNFKWEGNRRPKSRYSLIGN
ncbi:LPS export ABC transporter periplasmic protein LptC [Chitinophaga horti]|uniref:LPS export ABC transporter periplasmic protein LptC n=1 Tax=Chitinophaga horti TaxID=2920382 RepID=A0ABY6J3Q3_9BACT|nr:OstA-like protein [Chitinophaga horti]UYQ94295.1 LPS export ABC transporter periplasmic protein LptC [Chitinophaga horti]